MADASERHWTLGEFALARGQRRDTSQRLRNLHGWQTTLARRKGQRGSAHDPVGGALLLSGRVERLQRLCKDVAIAVRGGSTEGA